jgi:hypothetical protein
MSLKKTGQDPAELVIQDISQRLESLTVEFNLYFTGELRVPPERERVELEKKIRNLMYSGKKTARTNLLIQNISSRFSVYNNMWLKRMNEIETGVSPLQRKKIAYMEQQPKPKKPKGATQGVSLNSEDSFDQLFDKYAELVAKKSKKPPDKDKVINSIKAKMISSNVIDAKVNLSIVKGKLKIKIKSESEY